MIVRIIQQLIRFLFLIALQVIILNHIQWSGYVNPYVYVLFILLLPVETPNWLLLIIALLTGLTIDMFGNSGGIHAAATVLMGFARPGILRLIAPRDGYESETRLSPQVMGFNWFITYVTMMVLIHHFAYFYLEVFRFGEFFITFLKVLINSAITIGLILLGQYLFGKQLKRNERIIG
jgi:rod shape-determining protein MreD